MFREQLMLLGKEALYLRMKGRDTSHITAAIDKVVSEWRAAEPYLFWDEKDPLYRELRVKWDRLRKMRRKR